MIFDGRTPVFNSQEALDAINLLIEMKVLARLMGSIRRVGGHCGYPERLLRHRALPPPFVLRIESAASSVAGLIKSGTFLVKAAETDEVHRCHGRLGPSVSEY